MLISFQVLTSSSSSYHFFPIFLIKLNYNFKKTVTKLISITLKTVILALNFILKFKQTLEQEKL